MKPYGLGGRELFLPVDGGSTIYAGTLVAQLAATGAVVPGSTAASGPAVGVAKFGAVNAGSDGDVRCKVMTDQIFIFANGADTDACSEATLMGAPVYMHDDHTVYDNDAGGTLFRAGFFAGMEPDGKVRVFVSCFGRTVSVAADPGALTYNLVVGTANSALEALPNPTDTPSTADALRDDLVAVLIPALRNNFADVAAQIAAIRTALINAGLMA